MRARERVFDLTYFLRHQAGSKLCKDRSSEARVEILGIDKIARSA